MSYKDSLKLLEVDPAPVVQSRYQKCKDQLAKVKTANLEGTDRIAYDDMGEKLDSSLTRFMQEYKSQLAVNTELIENAKFKCRAISWGSVAVGILLLLFASKLGAFFGIAGLVTAIVGWFVAKIIANNMISGPAQKWASLRSEYLSFFGRAEDLHNSATGQYAEVDALYLRSLSETERGFEIQNRNLQKQMEAQAEAHQQQMEMQRQMLEEYRQASEDKRRR